MSEDLKNKLNPENGSFFKRVGFPLVIILVALYLFSYGFVGYKLWNWFISPIFSNNGTVKISSMIGMFLLVKLFALKLDIEKLLESKSEEELGLITVSVFAAPWISLFIGFLVKFLLL